MIYWLLLYLLVLLIHSTFFKNSLSTGLSATNKWDKNLQTKNVKTCYKNVWFCCWQNCLWMVWRRSYNQPTNKYLTCHVITIFWLPPLHLSTKPQIHNFITEQTEKFKTMVLFLKYTFFALAFVIIL